jgi:glycosyltransferase involved in cell wall biosynthesis
VIADDVQTVTVPERSAPAPRRSEVARACFFSHSPELAGAERILLDLVSGLVAEHGVACTVVLPGAGPLEARLTAAGAEVLEIPYGWWADFTPVTPKEARRRLAAGFDALAEALPRLAAVAPDVIFTSTLTIPWGAMAAALLGRPHLWYVTELGELDHDLHFFLPLPQVLDIVAGGSQRVLTVSETVRRRLFPHLDDERCRTLYCSIETPALPAEPPAPTFRRWNSAKVGVFGFLTPTKGQELALAAVSRLVGQGRDVELLLAGKDRGGQAARLAALAAELGIGGRVLLPGFVDPVPAMTACDVVLLAAQHEAFGRVAAEALLLGRPIVFPAAGGYLDYLEDGVHGLAYPAGDAAAAADCIGRLLDDPELARRLARQGGDMVRERFVNNGFVAAAHEHLAQALKSPPSPLFGLLAQLLGELAAAAAERLTEIREEREHVDCVREELRRATQALAEAHEELRRLHRAHAEAHTLTADLHAVCAALRTELSHVHQQYRLLWLDREKLRDGS